MLAVRDLTVSYGDTVAVDGVDLDVVDGETVALLGPSGCGKSSLLRAVAGLEPAGGRVLIAGEDVGGLRPDQRGVGLMFQDHALFPHRDVAGNVAFGLRMRRWDDAAIRHRVEEALTLVGLAGHGGRPVDALSGGEQQRVALARALAPEPRLLLLDEPLGSLDRVLRDRLLAELPAVFAEVGASVLYVTHDQDEALAIADRVVVMRAGRTVQEGTPDELWRRPADAFVARFLGLRNVLEGTVADGVARTVAGAVPVPDGTPPGPVELVLLPDALHLADDGDLRAEVVARTFAGDHFVIRVEAGGAELDVPVWGRPAPRVGTSVRLRVASDAVAVLGGR